ncbi:glycosyltransferase family 25 protein [Cyanobium sp. FGCU-6]|nr:glycosyltransferase family 25 protein [Cyanobium sp. FGCU6]
MFVLTLADARERQERLLAWGAAAGLEPGVFVEGVDLRRASDGFQAPVDGEERRRQRYGRPALTPPEYGCALGHRRLWSLLEERDLGWALVLEDDARPTRADWRPAVAALTTLLEASSLRGRPWVVHLAIDDHRRRTLALQPLTWSSPVPPECPGLGAVDPRLGCLWTTTAYLISRAAARALLADEASLPCLADDWEQRLQRRTVDPLLATRTALFLPDQTLDSQIEHRTRTPSRRIDRPRRKLLTLAYRAGWFARRH